MRVWERSLGFLRETDVYRSLDYVRTQCAQLAGQIHADLSAPEKTE